MRPNTSTLLKLALATAIAISAALFLKATQEGHGAPLTNATITPTACDGVNQIAKADPVQVIGKIGSLKNITVKVSGTVLRAGDLHKVVGYVFAGEVPVINKTLPFSEKVTPGPLSKDIKLRLPPFLPRFDLKFVLKAYDADGNENLCYSAILHI